MEALLEQLLLTGEVQLYERPTFPYEEWLVGVVVMMNRHFEEESLELAGPVLGFDHEPGVRAGFLMLSACWFLVCHDEPPAVVESALRFPTISRSPDVLLSVDLTFRYLPMIHRRARAISLDDPLTVHLRNLLLAWPLCGVMSDLAEPPVGKLDFGNHPGLEMLYAERFVRNPRPEWLPKQGRIPELVDWLRTRTPSASYTKSKSAG